MTTSGVTCALTENTASRSSASQTRPDPPAAAMARVLSGVRVVPVTSCPAASSIGSSDRPMTPVAPASRIRIGRVSQSAPSETSRRHEAPGCETCRRSPSPCERRPDRTGGSVRHDGMDSARLASTRSACGLCTVVDGAVDGVLTAGRVTVESLGSAAVDARWMTAATPTRPAVLAVHGLCVRENWTMSTERAASPPDVEVRRSARRRRTVSAHREGDDILMSVEATSPRARLRPETQQGLRGEALTAGLGGYWVQA